MSFWFEPLPIKKVGRKFTKENYSVNLGKKIIPQLPIYAVEIQAELS